jgi:threonine/homoserine/homoserine lactone efflux protein
MMSVDTTPPTGDSSLDAPAPPSGASRKPFAKRAAKLALWLPFVGLFILIVFAASIREPNGGQHLMIWSIIVAVCWLVWIVGLALGIIALRRRKNEGRKGVSGRAVIGVTLNVLFLGVTIWIAVAVAWMETKITRMRDKAATEEAAATRAKVGDGEALQKQLAAYADSAFVANVAELQMKYQMAGAALTNPPVLDVASVKSREELPPREEVIRDYIAASKDLRDFCDNATEAYRQELLNHKLAPEIREASMKAFIQRVQHKNPTIVALRKADVRRGEAMLKMLTFLDANWGQWEYRPETDRLQFKETKMSEDYYRAYQELQEISSEIVRLQAQAKSLNN